MRINTEEPVLTSAANLYKGFDPGLLAGRNIGIIPGCGDVPKLAL